MLHPNQTTRGFPEDTLQLEQLYPSTDSSLPFLSNRSTRKYPIRSDKQASITLKCVTISQFSPVCCLSWASHCAYNGLGVVTTSTGVAYGFVVATGLVCVATAGLVCVVITRLARVVICKFCSGAESGHGYNRIWA
jgi:hypothetical protein